MTRQIDLSDATFARLQKLAEPLVDGVEDVINKLADFYEHQRRPSVLSATAQPAAVGPRHFSAASPPDLTHTKLLAAKLAGRALSKPRWNGLLLEAVRLAKQHLRNGDDASRLIVVNFVRGKKEDDGYRFVPEVNLSVQGQDANSAWRGAFHIARQLGIPLEAEFAWRAKEGSKFPGVTGRLSI